MDLARIAGARWAVEECFQQAMAALAWLSVAKTAASKGPAAVMGR